VIQIYGATNGYLDRIDVGKVERFLADLTDSVHGNEAELLKKIAEGDWSDETQKQVDEAVKSFAEDFGFDLDEEGHPLDDDADEPSSGERDSGSERSDANGDHADEDDQGSNGQAGEGDAEGKGEEEEEAVPA
jgi:F-type H+-transporting ATPase subunit alpha